MSINANPGIVKTGLIFHYDASSVRSYAGPPIKNIATAITQNIGNTSNSTFITTNGTERVFIPTIGEVDAKYVDMWNDYSGGSGQCCPSPFGYGSDLATNGSTVHTYAIVYKSMNGYTHPNYMYRYEYNGATFVLEQGIFDTSKRIHLGDDWYWAWNTFTTNASTTRFNYCGYFMYEYLKYNRMYLAKVLLCQGDYSTLHPSKWPEVNTTRSATQAVTDLSKTATSVTMNGSPTYYTDRITIPNVNTAFLNIDNPTAYKMGTQDFTLSAWIKQLDNGGHVITEARDSSTLQGYLVAINYPGTGQISLFLNPSSGQVIYSTTAATLAANVPLNIAIVVKRSTSSIEFYVNGAPYDTVTGIHGSSISGLGDMYRIGYDRGGGTSNLDLYAYSHYNRALTEAEVRQNFNAQRGRFSL